jgi:NADH:ubiquinone oxidoreductase subunit 6 (subunit J)
MTVFFLKILCSIILGSTLFVIGVQNPIHSILLLIIVFGLGSIMLFYLNLEFFGLAFLIVYIGAIVILFLFIIMMLDIKMLNTGREEINFFSFKSLILVLLFMMLFTFLNQDIYYLQMNNNFFSEAVLYETSFTLP